MFDRLKSVFRSDDFIPGSSIFPSIDSDKIAKELHLAEQGTTRGQENQPPSEAKEFDHIETGIVERIEELRRKGIENFETNRRVYNERLARAGSATKEVEVAAGTAKGEFGRQVQVWHSAIEGPRERLADTYRWRARYRQINRLEYPAKEFEGWLKVFSMAIILIVLEAGMNTYLFSTGNEFGLLGGLFAAALVSVVNVGSSAILGYMARYVHRRNWFLKLFGLCFILGWVGFALVANLAVAHFRDGLEAGISWRPAAEQAVPALMSRPLELASIESWILAILGVLISTLAFRKGWHTDDPHPGYGRVERAVRDAREAYVSELDLALDDLAKIRDQAIADLQDANEQVRQSIGEAIDTLFGQSTLGAHLQTFLEQCDVKTAHLLAIYRDANRAARKTPAPKSFDRPYKFAPFNLKPIETARRENAESEAAKVTATVEAAVRDIFQQFDEARRAFDVARVVTTGEAT